jgi:hypothetical protein
MTWGDEDGARYVEGATVVVGREADRVEYSVLRVGVPGPEPMTGGVIVRCCNTRRVGGDCCAWPGVESDRRPLATGGVDEGTAADLAGADGVVIAEGAICRDEADETGRVGAEGAV